MTALTPSPAMWLVLDALAVYRLTRLVTADRILDRPRKWLRDRFGLGVFDFITCAWCTSIWLAAVVVVLTVFVPSEWKFVAYLLTCSAVAGYLSERA